MKRKELFHNITQRLRRHRRGLQNPRIMHPGRDWLIGILIGLVVFFGTVAWSINTYFAYLNLDEADAVLETDPATIYRAALVEAALDIYAERAKEQEQLSTALRGSRVSVPPEQAPEESIVATSSLATSTEALAVPEGSQPSPVAVEEVEPRLETNVVQETVPVSTEEVPALEGF